jgi:hypothetical protein
MTFSINLCSNHFLSVRAAFYFTNAPDYRLIRMTPPSLFWIRDGLLGFPQTYTSSLEVTLHITRVCLCAGFSAVHPIRSRNVQHLLLCRPTDKAHQHSSTDIAGYTTKAVRPCVRPLAQSANQSINSRA